MITHISLADLNQLEHEQNVTNEQSEVSDQEKSEGRYNNMDIEDNDYNEQSGLWFLNDHNS